ncbi:MULTISPECIES: TetR/AcrR family transcriptional regulator [Alteromonadaceae]|uniref:TetR/AcrR family transcriptional regulator n=1 Tax=Alteromonadaceae TaxID=72275 RepID=UPI001C09D648|nr:MULTISPECIES: TetR/AcrR family transcriptional regulator [Aliiglaciecola]MBU2878784.1 TetR/AcrR family transcriptional regulator [Aliiglaciecola lipolytica]MDO6711318.1 TetR/AcrR family transcriptional regulator [Aliiglaciecola sp. 2_MG-2023]MDO6752233.1 TetR/AcrR family transcriptional regulator [Aliiglaciecola sp. 1_MG-2023]
MNTINPTKVALMDLAQEILQTKSFSSVSFQTLALGVGIKKGSVYYHFQTKEDLSEAIIDRLMKMLQQSLLEIQNEPVENQLSIYVNWFENHIGAAQKLCPAASFAATWDAVPERTKSKVQELYNLHQHSLAKMIQNGRDKGVFAITNKSAEELAIIAFALLQGGLVSSRVSQSRYEFEACKAAALHMVKAG